MTQKSSKCSKANKLTRIESSQEHPSQSRRRSLGWRGPKSRKTTTVIPTIVQLKFSSGGIPLSQKIQLTQVVNDVDLVAYHVTAGDTRQDRRQSLVMLKPFPEPVEPFSIGA